MFDDDYELADVLSGEDGDDEIDSDEALMELLNKVGAPDANPRAALTRMARARLKSGARLTAPTAVRKAVARLAKFSGAVLSQTGKIEAEYLRRPNTLCSVSTPVIASGATSSFSVTPGLGNSFYRIMGFAASDEQCNIFGFTSLKVGGQEHVQFSQSTPTPPVANAVPWAIFKVAESAQVYNLAPWSGQVFDATVPITGTIANMTVAASGDAVTVSARCVFLTQTDPCGRNYEKTKELSRSLWGNMKRNRAAFAGLIRG